MVLIALDQFQRKSVSEEFLKNIDKEDLTCLQFSENEIDHIDWENANEFEFKGKMYDVVTSEKINGIIYFYCWNDQKETALNQKIDDTLEMLLGTDNEDEDDKEVLAKLYKSFSPTSNASTFVLIEEAQNRIFIYRADFTSLESDPPSPPPQIG